MKSLILIFFILFFTSCESNEDKIANMNIEIDSLRVKSKQLESELKFEEDFIKNTNRGGGRQSIINIETKIFYINKSIDSINSEIINLQND